MAPDEREEKSHPEKASPVLRSHKDQLGALASIAARIGIYTDTGRLAREAMQAIADLLPIKTALLLLADPQSGSLTLEVAFNLPREELDRRQGSSGWDDCIEGEVIRRKEPVLIENVSTDPRAVHYSRGSMSLGIIPLMNQDKAIGVLSVSTAAPHRFEPSDMEFLLTLGSQLGIYLENSRLVEQLKTTNRKLLGQNQDLEELLSVISHDLRSPLATIGGYASLLMQRGETLDPEERVRYAQTIFRKTKETSRRFDDLLSIFRDAAAQDGEGPVEVDIRTVIEEALEEADPERKYGRFTVTMPQHLPVLLGNPFHLVHIFSNLFSNSFKFIGDQEKPLITINCQTESTPEGPAHRFSITDNGMGIPADYIPEIFRPFTRVPMEREIEGSGVGLASVYRIIRRQGGTIDVQSVEGQGTTVSFTLPWKEVESR